MWETGDGVEGSISEIVGYGLADDWFDTYAGKVRALQLADVSGAAKKTLHPDRLVWVVVGDRSKIEAGIRELNLGTLRFLDADGNPVN